LRPADELILRHSVVCVGGSGLRTATCSIVV
jgi:hypothetical protein